MPRTYFFCWTPLSFSDFSSSSLRNGRKDEQWVSIKQGDHNLTATLCNILRMMVSRSAERFLLVGSISGSASFASGRGSSTNGLNPKTNRRPPPPESKVRICHPHYESYTDQSIFQ